MPTTPFSSLSPSDAAVALRSFPRRFRDASSAAVVDLDDEVDQDEIDEVSNRPGADGWSGVDHVAAAAGRVDAAGRTLRSVLVSPTRPIDEALVTDGADETPTHSGHLEHELDRLDETCSGLAEQIESADADQWLVTRPTTGSGSANPLEVVQTTVGVTLDHLRSLERVLREVRGRPGPS